MKTLAMTRLMEPPAAIQRFFFLDSSWTTSTATGLSPGTRRVKHQSCHRIVCVMRANCTGGPPGSISQPRTTNAPTGVCRRPLTSRHRVWNCQQALTTDTPPIVTRLRVHVGYRELVLNELIVTVKGALVGLYRGDAVVEHLRCISLSVAVLHVRVARDRCSPSQSAKY